MATQIYGKDHAVVPDVDTHDQQAPNAPHGGAFRGLMFAMLFNVFLVAIAAGAWALWRVFIR